MWLHDGSGDGKGQVTLLIVQWPPIRSIFEVQKCKTIKRAPLKWVIYIVIILNISVLSPLGGMYRVKQNLGKQVLRIHVLNSVLHFLPLLYLYLGKEIWAAYHKNSLGSCADLLKNRRLLGCCCNLVKKMEFNVLHSQNLLTEVLFDPVHMISALGRGRGSPKSRRQYWKVV